MYFNDKFLSQTKYISMSHLHPKSLEYMVWNFCKQIIKVDNKYYNKGCRIHTPSTPSFTHHVVCRA